MNIEKAHAIRRIETIRPQVQEAACRILRLVSPPGAWKPSCIGCINRADCPIRCDAKD
jgi:hypothetical protein